MQSHGSGLPGFLMRHAFQYSGCFLVVLVPFVAQAVFRDCFALLDSDGCRGEFGSVPSICRECSAGEDVGELSGDTKDGDSKNKWFLSFFIPFGLKLRRVTIRRLTNYIKAIH